MDSPWGPDDAGLSFRISFGLQVVFRCQTQRNGGKQWTAATAAKSEKIFCLIIYLWACWRWGCFYWWSGRFCPELLPNYRHVCLLFLLCGIYPLRNSVRLSAAGIYVDPLQKLDFFDFCTSKNRWTEFAALAAALAPCNTAKIRRDWCNSGRFSAAFNADEVWNMPGQLIRFNWSEVAPWEMVLFRDQEKCFSNLVEQLFQLPFSRMCLLHCRI